MELDRDPLAYATPHREPSAPPVGTWVRGLGLLPLLGGIVCVALAFPGVDNWTQVLTGCGIASFGLLVIILGQILHAVETRR
jgi:hypothetical protein